MASRRASARATGAGRERGSRAASLRGWVVAGLLAAFVVAVLAWRAAAMRGPVAELSQWLDAGVVAASLAAAVWGRARLRAGDVALAVLVGTAMGALLPATGFYPLLAWSLPGAAGHPWAVAALHGFGVAAAALGGLACMRHGGPVRWRMANGAWRAAAVGFAVGALIGLPLALANGYANTLTQARPYVWQASAFPLVEALQPAWVEEVVYRFALLGLLAWLLRPFWGARSAAIAGALALLVHAFAHNGALLVADPVAYLAIGAVLALLWGVPATVFALRRDLESAVGFHWVQDAVRFLGGL